MRSVIWKALRLILLAKHHQATSQDGSLLDTSDFLIDVTCGRGANRQGRWRYTPTSNDTGSTTFTVSCYDQAPQRLCFGHMHAGHGGAVHPSTPIGAQRFVIGDSTTNNGTVLAELVNLFDGDTQCTLTLLGTNNGAAYDADGDARAVSSESVSGWSFAMFDTGHKRTGQSLVARRVRVSVRECRCVRLCTLSVGGRYQPDEWRLGFINLGINDLFSYLTDDTASTAMLAMATILSRWITSTRRRCQGYALGYAWSYCQRQKTLLRPTRTARL